MKMDKFGVIALVIGLAIFVATLHFGFFGGNVAGWTMNNIANVIVTIILSGLVLLGLFAIVIGLLLLFV